VVEAISLLKNEFPELRYVIGGGYDLEEKKYLDEIIERLGLQGSIIFSGFIPDSDLPAHFRMADIYIMPSSQEGFGLVFIEAMYYGIPVIAGNSDGSVDALLEGALGSLVDPMNINEIKNAIKNILTNIKNTKPDYKLLMNHFSFENYKKKLNLYY
jgi:glycosyltransferase involved in cell wall biosynthesis